MDSSPGARHAVDRHSDCRPAHPLAGVTVAFDLDNTLLDPTGREYAATVAAFLSQVDLGLAIDERLEAFESVRSTGNALERLGLGNPIHARGHPDALAILCITRCRNRTLRTDLAINDLDRRLVHETLEEAVRLFNATIVGTFDSRLAAEIALRRFLRGDERVDRLRALVRRVADHGRIVAWAETYGPLERRHTKATCLPCLAALSSLGAELFVISDGRRDIQSRKLDRLGIARLLAGRVLTTAAAADIPGRQAFDERLDGLLECRIHSTPGPETDDLVFLWRYRCVMDSWGSKTAAFYGRALHAIQQNPTSPESSFGQPNAMPLSAWRDRPLRFVMIGDRHDIDAQPVIELLGARAALTLRLCQGKYADRMPEACLPADRQPRRTFHEWDRLASYLTHELTADAVSPIDHPPWMVEPGAVPAEWIERGLNSPLEAVRCVACAAAGTACREAPSPS